MNAPKIKPENNALEQCASVDGVVATLNITGQKVLYYKTKMFNIFSRSRWRTEMLNIEQA